MMTAKQWARVRYAGVHGLRRGAWYAVVAEGKAGMLVLSVSKRNVPVPRGQLDLAGEPPAHWSIVEWKASERGAQRASEAGIGPTYAVCPGCRARARIEPIDAVSMVCLECGEEFSVDWERRC